MDCSLSGSSIHGIFQARILKWVAFPAPGYLPDPGIEPVSPALQADSLLSELPGTDLNQNGMDFCIYSSHVWITDWTLSVLGSYHSFLPQVAFSPKKSRCSINVCQISYPLHTHRHSRTHTRTHTYARAHTHTHTPAYSGKSVILPHFGCPTVFLSPSSIPLLQLNPILFLPRWA